MRQRILIGILLSSSVVAACGSEAAVETPPGTVEVVAIEEQLVALRENIAGTVDQTRSLMLANQIAFQESHRACMADGGYDYTPPPLEDRRQDWEHMPLGSDYFALLPLADPTAGENFAAGELRILHEIESIAAADANPNTGFLSLGPDQQAAYGARTSECDAAIPAQDAIARPDKRGVGLAFEHMVLEVESLPATHGRASEYESCMAGLGVPDALGAPDPDLDPEGLDTLRGLRRRISSLFRDAETDERLAPGSSEWEGAVDRQNAIAEADRTCRSAIHSVALSELSGRMEKLEQDYEAELDAIARDWVEVAKQSEAIIASSDPSYLSGA